MKICIPTMDDRGKEGMPSDHFGSAPFFTFVDTETGEYEAVRNGGSSHVHGSCQPLKFLGTRTGGRHHLQRVGPPGLFPPGRCRDQGFCDPGKER